MTVAPAPSPDGRPSPPPELDGPAAEQWKVYVSAMPSGWFTREMEPVLSELCQVIQLSNATALELRKIKSLRRNDTLHKFLKIARTKLELSARVMQLSTKLRLTVQSRIRSEKAAQLVEANRFVKPWDLTGDGADRDRADEPGPVDWTPGRSRLKN